MVSAGGPATNAAVAFAHWGHAAQVLASLGTHPLTQLIRADLVECGVAIADLTPAHNDSPPVSSILVTQATGERAVVSINAQKCQASLNAVPSGVLGNVDVVLIDGHQMEVGQAIAQVAQEKGIPIVIDGGSWKPGFDTVMKLANYVICSANFQPPGCDPDQVLSRLKQWGIPNGAITHGNKPIAYYSGDIEGTLAVPTLPILDSLGAGDIFHGAFCHFILHNGFVSALAKAAQVASFSCQFLGTRQWRHKYSDSVQ
jgi:sugar/nucleoside kinase (ribokinase family)